MTRTQFTTALLLLAGLFLLVPESSAQRAGGPSIQWTRPKPERQAQPAAPAAPSTPAPQPAPQPSAGRPHRDGHHHHSSGPKYRSYGYPAYGYPLYGYSNYGYPGYGYPYGSYDPYGYPYSYYRRPYWQPAPLYIPAETLYGPESVKRFMGLDRMTAPSGGAVYDSRRGSLSPSVPQPAKPAPGSGVRSQELAQRYLGFGDALFADQKYGEALQRYRKATEISPTLGETFFRQGYAQMAMGRYESAAAAIRRGLELDPVWPDSGFKNDDLYGQNRLAKTSHMEALADAAAKNPTDARPLFLLGVLLHFDGQQQRAAAFFQRARQIDGAGLPVGLFLGE